MNRFERRKKAIEEGIREKIDAYKAIYKKAEEEDRDPTDEERLEIESHLKAIETLKEEKGEVEANIKTIERVEDLGREIGPVNDAPDVRVTPGGEPLDRLVKTIGQQFVQHESFKRVSDQYKTSGGAGKFDTGGVELQMKAGTLLEGAQGGGLVSVPQLIPGVVDKLFQPLRIADLLLSGQANTSSVRYVVEGTATSGAAGVAEGGAKPASNLALSTQDMPVTKVATSIKVSDEMLADAAQVESYINGRLTLFVVNEEERQIVLGAGSGSNELKGITGAGINTYGRGTVDNNAVALFKAMNGQRGSALLEPDWIAINPANYQSTRLLQDANQQFYGGGPFSGPYGNGGQQGASNQVSGAQDYIWGKPVIVTTAIGAGTALIGTRSAAQLWTRGGVTVQATNSNEDDFLHDLVAIRAEKREALTVYRPAAFTAVTGLA